jgi:hypothetical protein
MLLSLCKRTPTTIEFLLRRALADSERLSQPTHTPDQADSASGPGPTTG